MKLRVAKAVAEWIRIARDAGWHVERTRRGHLRFEGPNGKTTVITNGRHPSHRSLENDRAQLARVGVPIRSTPYNSHIPIVNASLPMIFSAGVTDVVQWEPTKPSGVEEEIEIEMVKKDESNDTSPSPNPSPSPSPKANGRASEPSASTSPLETERALARDFVKLGRLAQRICAMPEAERDLVIEFVSWAACIGLATEELVDALKPD